MFCGWKKQCLHITYIFEKHVVILLDERYYKDTTSFLFLVASLCKRFNLWQTSISRREYGKGHFPFGASSIQQIHRLQGCELKSTI